MLSRDEIQRAHDILHEAIAARPPMFSTSLEEQIAGSALCALCWVLEHRDNTVFANQLYAMEREFASRGAVLKRSPVPFVGRPPNNDG